MKLIIAGSREFDNYELLSEKMNELQLKPNEVVSGTCRGADKLGEQWANTNRVKIVRFPANWDKYGKSAGPIRNREMAQYADTLLAFWNGRKGGTSNMIKTAQELRLNVFIVEYENSTSSLF